MKSVAILIYGHMRTYKNTYNSLFKKVINNNRNVKFDIFISTWDELDVESDKISNVEINDIKTFYKPKKIDIVSKDCESYVEYLSKSSNDNSIMAINTSYSIKNCTRMLFEYEVEKNEDYDFVILTRPDIFFNQGLILEDLLAGKIRGLINSDTNNSLFVPYIISDFYGQIMDPRYYICGIDLLCIYSRDLADSTLFWQLDNDDYRGLLPEFALTKSFYEKGAITKYIGYEKDRAFYIRRNGYAMFYSVFFIPIRVIATILFYCSTPFFILSGKFRQKIMFNIHLLSISKLRRLWNFLK